MLKPNESPVEVPDIPYADVIRVVAAAGFAPSAQRITKAPSPEWGSDWLRLPKTMREWALSYCDAVRKADEAHDSDAYAKAWSDAQRTGHERFPQHPGLAFAVSLVFTRAITREVAAALDVSPVVSLTPSNSR